MSTALVAQNDPLTEGRTYFGKQEWDKAIISLTEAVRRNDSSGAAWFWLGLAHYQTKHYAVARSALVKADALRMNTGFTRFALARCDALLGDVDGAFAWLDKAVAAGFSGLARFDADSAIALLRPDPRYTTTRESIDRKVRPAHYDQRYRQLDFWVGEWDVFDQQGTLVGTNVITKELEGAMLVEHWTNAFGTSGGSINYFDPGSGKFKQQWVSQSGDNTSYEGGLQGTAMVMLGKDTQPDGTTGLNRMTFTPNPDGSVTQSIESSTDGGTTWTPNFTGIYRRKSSR